VRAQIFSTGAALNVVDRELARLKPALDRLAEVEHAREALKPKLMVLGKAQGDTMKWYDVLISLKRTVPIRAWLTSLNVEGGRDENQTVRLTGVTETQAMVGETMLRLNATRLYQAVDLHYTQSGKVGDHDTVEFEVAAHLPPVEKPKNDADATQTR
jgi:Tfp pilus assembly protein PilN